MNLSSSQLRTLALEALYADELEKPLPEPPSDEVGFPADLHPQMVEPEHLNHELEEAESGSSASSTLFPSNEAVSPSGLAMSNDELRALAEQDLFVFAKGILGYDWLDREIHLPLCKLLQDYETNRRLVIVLPRSWLKTTLCSIAYPMWRAVRSKGNIRCLLVQNTYDNAVAKLKSIKDHWEKNELLRTLWPELLPTPQCKWTSDSLCLNRSESYAESTFECGGTRSQFISRHYDLIDQDDTVAPKLNELGEDNVLPVKEDIGQAIGFHKSCVDLQNDFSTAQILVVGTRWFEKDLISYIRDEQNEALKREEALPYFIFERACLETNGKPNPDGQPTYPKRFGWEVLKQLRAEKGSYMFSCLYLNCPLRDRKSVV